ncbi:dipeptide ABC transporter ATP-binding protein [Nocardioides psychrotolerans]|uniref:ABC transporter ATP-binding protein n=1 Tax=Nocardioides psychrotolerans TaxID=1005945 RepID=UPI003138189F
MAEQDTTTDDLNPEGHPGGAEPQLKPQVASFDELAAQAHTAAQLDLSRGSVLEVDNLKMYFPVKAGGLIRRKVGDVQAVDGVSFQVPRGGSLGLVGESGCGKSTTGRLITRLYEPTGGRILFEDRDMAKMKNKELKPLRREVQMIFQDPYTSLNPRHTVGSIIGAPLEVHKVVPKDKILPRVQELLEIVGLNPEHYNRYPNEFSGGQRQRIGIARALTLNPKLLVADEPVSALDVSIQAQVINLLQDIQKEFDVAFLFIAHDLAVVRHFCPEVAVMYLGKIVEIGDRDSIYANSHHPYTQALLSAVPDVKQAAIGGRRERIRLEGDVPSPINPPSGCRFRTRCPIAQEICAKHEPPLLQIGKRHKVACHFPGPINQHPDKPITARLIGTDDAGSPDPGATPSSQIANKPGYDDTWYDLDAKTFGRA